MIPDIDLWFGSSTREYLIIMKHDHSLGLLIFLVEFLLLLNSHELPQYDLDVGLANYATGINMHD